MAQTLTRNEVAITAEALRDDPEGVFKALFDRLGGEVTIVPCPDGGVYRDRVRKGEGKQPGDETCLVHLTGVALW